MSRVTWVFLGPTPRFVTIKHVTVTLGIEPTPPPVCHGQYTRVRTPIHRRTHRHTHAGPAYLPRAHPRISCLLGESYSRSVCLSRDLADEEQNGQRLEKHLRSESNSSFSKMCANIVLSVLYYICNRRRARRGALPHFSKDVRLIPSRRRTK